MEAYTLDDYLRNADSMCRACAQELGTAKPVKAKPCVQILETPDLLNKLSICISNEFSTNNKCSKYLCMDCYDIVNEFYEFREMCLESIERFEELQQQSEVAKPTTNVDEGIIKEEYGLIEPEMTSNEPKALTVSNEDPKSCFDEPRHLKSDVKIVSKVNQVVIKEEYLADPEISKEPNRWFDEPQHKIDVKPLSSLNEIIIKEEYGFTDPVLTINRATASAVLHENFNELQQANREKHQQPTRCFDVLDHKEDTKTFSILNDVIFKEDYKFTNTAMTSNTATTTASFLESVMNERQEAYEESKENHMADLEQSSSTKNQRVSEEDDIEFILVDDSDNEYSLHETIDTSPEYNKDGLKNESTNETYTSPESAYEKLNIVKTRKPQNFKMRLNAHIRKERGLKPYLCMHKGCNNSFNEWFELNRHLKEHGKKSIKYMCDQAGCDKVYELEYYFNRHRQLHEKYGANLKSLHKCMICGKLLQSAKFLEAHLTNHKKKRNRPFLCDQPNCTRRFTTKGMRSEHIKRRHRVKKYACLHCDIRRATQTELKRHMKCHMRDRICPHPSCKMVFKSFAKFKAHICDIHGDLSYMQHACRYCGLKFDQPWVLKYHEMRHTGEKPHICPKCGNAFIHKSSLRAHMKNIHGRQNHCNFYQVAQLTADR
ncbi:zinc finger protein 699-like [Eurosta solidaginis]|uniref:zinc finger protein 699-like n=1 Tax=Eurosta solidaginis TaxID=178769 RepID=UPI0035308848